MLHLGKDARKLRIYKDCFGVFALFDRRLIDNMPLPFVSATSCNSVNATKYIITEALSHWFGLEEFRFNRIKVLTCHDTVEKRLC